MHFALLDELHARKTRAVYDVIDGAHEARAVAAMDHHHRRHRPQRYLLRAAHARHQVLDRVVRDERVLGVVYTLDDGDAGPFGGPGRVKANPELALGPAR